MLLLLLHISSTIWYRVDDITVAVPSTLVAAAAYNSSAGPMASAGGACIDRDVDDTMPLQTILSDWIVMSYKTQFPDCWDLRRLEAMILNSQTTSMYDS